MPTGIGGPRPTPLQRSSAFQAVYFPSCVCRTMGPARGDADREPLHAVVERLLHKAGCDILWPRNLEALCCGTPFESKGFSGRADEKARELEAVLLEASAGGRLPVICDTSPCLYRMRRVMDRRLTLLDPVEFTLDHLMDRLDVTPVNETVAYHHTCSSIKMGLEAKAMALAKACAAGVVIPDRVGCCGFAGDRGFSYPELNASALQPLRPALAGRCTSGYSTSRTCEIGLSVHSGIHYKSILYLVDKCARPKKTE
jgi:D-lactate dehydrogenase